MIVHKFLAILNELKQFIRLKCDVCETNRNTNDGTRRVNWVRIVSETFSLREKENSA